MKSRKSAFIATGLTLVTFLCTASTCSVSQAGASATYIAAETVTAALLQKNPSLLVPMSLIVQDWAKFQSGTITSADEVSLLDNIVTLTGKKLTPVEAAALDGAMQQIKGNMNASAPTPLQGGAAAIVQDVINGVARELVIYQTPALASTVGK